MPAVEQALRSLAAPADWVRPTTTGWQLDHDYLARGILKAEANANRWRVRLAERAEQHEAAAGTWAWWRTLLTPSEQVAFALAWLRGKRPYGDRLGFARLSSLRLLPATSLVVLAVLVVYVVNGSWVSTTVLNSLGTDQDLSEEEAKALVELADASLLARAFVAWGISLDAHLARKAEPKAASVIRAITRTDAAAASRLRDWIVDPAILSSEPAIRAFGSAAVTAIDPDERVVAAVLAAMPAAKDDPFASSALAQAYAAAAQKLPEDKAPQAVAAVLAAMPTAKDDPFASSALAQAYAAAAQKLPEDKAPQAVAAVLAAMAAAKDSPSTTRALAQAYAAAAQKLPEDKAPQAVAAVLAAMAAAKDDPFATGALAQAYAAGTQRLPAKKRGKDTGNCLRRRAGVLPGAAHASKPSRRACGPWTPTSRCRSGPGMSSKSLNSHNPPRSKCRPWHNLRHHGSQQARRRFPEVSRA